MHSPLDLTSELNFRWHYSDSLSMNRTEVGIFKGTYQICLCCLLKRSNDGALEPKINLEILSNLTNQELEWKFANQKLGSLLVLHDDFFESYCSWPELVWLLYATCSGSRFLDSLCCQLLSWSLSSSGFSGSLLSTRHWRRKIVRNLES
uniref:Uncharacterized protein n=1 Tax=Nelumbo nucifera TaxID=4432 RepID=A0A822YXT4_NELNU|nr:TPA_asm: hypothetical protein HUJ06_006206 [Nelumbo nucifera]